EVFMQAAFYATPIVYPIANARSAGYLLIFNPVAQIVQDLRYVLITNQTDTIDTLYHNDWIRLLPISLTVLLAILAGYYFRRRSPYFAEEL
ncbi:MAG TPA: hypothetical protein VNG90_02700, partial [Candidatus Acidoferrum sp.]|nr:hypothetical protein [Candidatus Acidoferrum sp.]